MLSLCSHKSHKCEVSPRFVDVDILSPLCRKHVDEQKIYFVLRRKFVDKENFIGEMICRWRNFVEKIIIVENSNNLNYVDGDIMSMNIKNYNRILFCFLK